MVFKHLAQTKHRGLSVVLPLCLLATADIVRAETDPALTEVEDLQSLSIEELSDISVISVSRRATSLSSASASVYVITGEDIIRSGATSLPEALRLAPNLEVARANGYTWTVTARGFNSPETSNKLLVLINGRSVYEPIGGGVIWAQVPVDLGVIERIEVISGPGGTMWGANAVNGVINVITRRSDQQQDFSGELQIGGFERSATARIGGEIGENLTFRAYVRSFEVDATKAVDPNSTFNDAFRGVSTGFRLGGTWGQDALSVRAIAYDHRTGDDFGQFKGESLSGNWTRNISTGAVLSVNVFLTNDERRDPSLYEQRQMLYADFQRSSRPRGPHTVTWGGEFRHWKENFTSFNDFSFAEPKTDISLGSLYVQDEINLNPRTRLTLGVKAEYSSYSGLEWLPNVRLAWQSQKGMLVWGAISRAVRTPNRIERELHAPIFLAPSPDFEAEKLIAYELGWRWQPTPNSTVSLTGFHHAYDDLRSYDITLPTVFPLVLRNDVEGSTSGIEAWGKVDITPFWRISGGANWLSKDFNVKPGRIDAGNMAVTGHDPEFQAQIRSQWILSRSLNLDIGLRHVGRIKEAPVPAYTEADAHLIWRVNDKLTASIDGLNLLNEGHLEVWQPNSVDPRYVPRSIFATLRYGY